MRTGPASDVERLDAAQKLEDTLRDSAVTAIGVGMYDVGQDIIALVQRMSEQKKQLLVSLRNHKEMIARSLGEGI
jgi:hypothetical protein